jgi:beta-N-acetylhexosaminidase
MIADQLTDVGINVNCVPLLDVPVSGAHNIIGDRALSGQMAAITALGRAVADGCLDGSVLPVIKHIPGHGRATADSHLSLPVIEVSQQELEQTDFSTFKALNDLPLGMTGHLLLTAVDPAQNVSTSKTIISGIIRDWIGFDGLLMSDDLSMEALSGTIGERAEQVVTAGCDVALYCKGVFDEMQKVAAAVPPLTGKALQRFDAAYDRIQPPKAYDRDEAEELLGLLQS